MLFAAEPRCSHVAQVANKRKVAAVESDGNEEGELTRPERTVRLAALSGGAAQRQASGDEREPASHRLGDSTGGMSQTRAPARSRLGRPNAGQAPLQAPSEVRSMQCQPRLSASSPHASGHADIFSMGLQAATDAETAAKARLATTARLPARALRVSQADAAPAAAAPQAAAPRSTRHSRLDTPLSDRPGRPIGKAPPAVKTLQELRKVRSQTCCSGPVSNSQYICLASVTVVIYLPKTAASSSDGSVASLTRQQILSFMLPAGEGTQQAAAAAAARTGED